MTRDSMRQTMPVSRNVGDKLIFENPPQRSWSRPTENSGANALTCDVEDYFQVSAFEHLVPKESWDSYDCRIPKNVDRVLQLLSDANAKATFFSLGWVASRLPAVIRRIVDEGHELASHGMNHTRIWAQSSDGFRNDVAASKKLLEDVGGVKVRGYRAASWSLNERTPWAHDIIGEAGYEYSSSLYPVRHDLYGVPDAPAYPFYPLSGNLLEVPASTTRVLGRNWPAAGGGYFRLFPLKTSLWMIRRINRTTGFPALFYFHPWELDPDQPRMSGASAKSRFRHYLNLHRFENRLTALLSEFAWGRMDDIYLPKTGQ